MIVNCKAHFDDKMSCIILILHYSVLTILCSYIDSNHEASVGLYISSDAPCCCRCTLSQRSRQRCGRNWYATIYVFFIVFVSVYIIYYYIIRQKYYVQITSELENWPELILTLNWARNFIWSIQCKLMGSLIAGKVSIVQCLIVKAWQWLSDSPLSISKTFWNIFTSHFWSWVQEKKSKAFSNRFISTANHEAKLLACKRF